MVQTYGMSAWTFCNSLSNKSFGSTGLTNFEHLLQLHGHNWYLFRIIYVIELGSITLKHMMLKITTYICIFCFFLSAYGVT